MTGGDKVVSLRQTLELRLRSDVKSKVRSASEIAEEQSGILVQAERRGGPDSRLGTAELVADHGILIAAEDNKSGTSLRKTYSCRDNKYGLCDQEAEAIMEMLATPRSRDQSLEQRWIDFWIQLQTHQNVASFEEKLEQHTVALSDQHRMLENVVSKVAKLRGMFSSLQEQIAMKQSVQQTIICEKAAAKRSDTGAEGNLPGHVHERLSELENSFCNVSQEFDRMDQNVDSRLSDLRSYVHEKVTALSDFDVLAAELSDQKAKFSSRFVILEKNFQRLKEQNVNAGSIQIRTCWSAWQEFTVQQRRASERQKALLQSWMEVSGLEVRSAFSAWQEALMDSKKEKSQAMRDRDLQQFLEKYFDLMESKISDLNESVSDKLAEFDEACKKFASCRDLNMISTEVAELNKSILGEVNGKLSTSEQTVRQSILGEVNGKFSTLEQTVRHRMHEFAIAALIRGADEDAALIKAVWLGWLKFINHRKRERDKQLFQRHLEDLLGDQAAHLHHKFSALSTQVNERLSDVENLKGWRQKVESVVNAWKDASPALDERISNLEELRQPLRRVQSVAMNWEACREALTRSLQDMQMKFMSFEDRLRKCENSDLNGMQMKLLDFEDRLQKHESSATNIVQMKLVEFEQRLRKCECAAAPQLPLRRTVTEKLTVETELLQSVCGVLSGELEQQISSQMMKLRREIHEAIDVKTADMRKRFSSLEATWQVTQSLDSKVAELQRTTESFSGCFASLEKTKRSFMTLEGQLQAALTSHKSIAALEFQMQAVKNAEKIADTKVVKLAEETERLSRLVASLEPSTAQIEFSQMEHRLKEFMQELRMMGQVRDQILHRMEASSEEMASRIAMLEKAIVPLESLTQEEEDEEEDVEEEAPTWGNAAPRPGRSKWPHKDQGE